jgi:S-adenosylmethionine:tRNA ribosyltransferase-isomerase
VPLDMTPIETYDYELPTELIAQFPLKQRSDARLMIVNRARNTIDHAHVRDLPEIVSPGDTLVLNDTHVIKAQLCGYRTATGGRWHGLFLQADAAGVWRVLSKTRGRLAVGETITLIDRQARDHSLLHMLAPLGEGEWAARPADRRPHLELLEAVGRVPLPHYIRDGLMMPQDVTAYQTVYAVHPGSVAAPTAGLHLTHELLGRLRQAGVEEHHVTLHIGLGTFRPIASEDIESHRMQPEWGCIAEGTARALRSARRRGGRVVAVGTTTTRLLESAARSGSLAAYCGETDLFIRPPFQFHAVDCLLTNFHLPRSTLLVLVRTFGGDALIRRAYAEAIEEQYRFYSYGDAMLIV